MFSKIFIDRPRFAIVISLIMVLAGVISLFKLPVAEYPEIAPPSLYVMATYPGASGEVIAQTVAMPIDEGLGQGSKLSVGGGGGRPSGPFPE